MCQVREPLQRVYLADVNGHGTLLRHDHLEEYFLKDEVEVLRGGQANEASLGLVHYVYLIPILLSVCWINLGSHIVFD